MLAFFVEGSKPFAQEGFSLQLPASEVPDVGRLQPTHGNPVRLRKHTGPRRRFVYIYISLESFLSWFESG